MKKNYFLDIWYMSYNRHFPKFNGDNLIAGYDRDNDANFIQIFYHDMDSPILSYEKYKNSESWEYCAWQGYRKDSKDYFDRLIVTSIIEFLKETSFRKKYKVINKQLKLF